MIKKIMYIMRMLGYKIRYKNKIQFSGVTGFERNTKVVVKSGRVQFGHGFCMRTGSYIAAVHGGSITIGDTVFINRNCSFVCQDSITIGEHCAFGPNVTMYDHDHCFGFNGIESGYKKAPIIIEKNCWIGAGVIILKGTHIGEGCVVGAGTVVRGEIPAHSVVTSESARKLRITPIEDK